MNSGNPRNIEIAEMQSLDIENVMQKVPQLYHRVHMGPLSLRRAHDIAHVLLVYGLELQSGHWISR